jgi:prepilin-type N-terminal cleavage/methylation domain-containing protein
MSTRAKSGFTMIEIVVGLTIATVLAVAFYATFSLGSSTTSEAENRARRAGEAAAILYDLASEIAALETTNPPTSFLQTVGAYPNTLSQLSTQITTADRNSCNRVTDAYSGAAPPSPLERPGYTQGWKGPYYRIEFPSGGTTQIAEGFILQDDLVRDPTVPPNNPKGAEFSGRLQMRMIGVTLLDAQALDLGVDNLVSGTAGTVKYANTDPTDVNFEITVSDC